MSRTIIWDRVGWWLALAVLSFGMSAELGAQVPVRVAWDPNPENNLAGYRIYYGRTAAGYSTNVVDVGLQTTGEVTGLGHSTEYFFYVTAYNVFGLESDPSAVLRYTTPPPLSLGMDSQLIALAPSEITLRPVLSGYRPPGVEPVIFWRETSSAGLVITGANTLTPRIQIPAPGQYGFEVTVLVGAAQFLTATSITAIENTPEPYRPDPLVLSYDYLPVDEEYYFHWNARSDRDYAFTFTRNLGDRTWVPLSLFFMGYSDHTVRRAWLASQPSVFFFVLERR